ncbi:MAG: hypothetical protein R3A48_21385 [Polyangiales bacterium]
MKPRPLSRRARFIDLGGDAFMPQQRMREIRWEEAVIRARVKRAEGGEVSFTHVHFHCPSGCCLGTPVARVHDTEREPSPTR